MRETTLSDVERINVIVLLVGSAASIVIMRDFRCFFSFAVASAIMILNFRYLRRIIEGFFSGALGASPPTDDREPAGEAPGASKLSKAELLIRLPVKFAALIALIVIVLLWGHVSIPFFVMGLSTVLLSILISQVVVAFSPEARRKQDGT